MRRHPKRFAQAPADPRGRTVLKTTKLRNGDYLLELDCRHSAIRRVSWGWIPDRLICTAFPAAGGLGGREFAP